MKSRLLGSILTLAVLLGSALLPAVPAIAAPSPLPTATAEPGSSESTEAAPNEAPAVPEPEIVPQPQTETETQPEPEPSARPLPAPQNPKDPSVLGRAAAAPEDASGPGIIDGTTPLSRIAISSDLSCDVRFAADTHPVFFGATACATLVAVNGELFGPASIPAGDGATPRTAFTPISQTRTGDGSTLAPYVVRTEVAAGDTGVRVVQQDIYFSGDDRYATAVDIHNDSSSTAAVKVWRAGDCYLADSDEGLGAIGHNWVACYSKDTDRVLQWIDDFGSDATMTEAGFSTVWNEIGAQQLFRDNCECEIHQDNGAGLSWVRSVTPGGIGTVAHHMAFSSATKSFDGDKDGIPDDWEVNGTPGGIDLAALGADPDRKDIFVFLDWLAAGDAGLQQRMGEVLLTTKPSQSVIDEITYAFAAAPVDNPDGSQGITLHIEVPTSGLPYSKYLAPDVVEGTPLDDQVLAAAERLADSRLSPTERKIYRYGIIGARLAPGFDSTGVAELPGDVFAVGQKRVDELANGRRATSGTIVHELGHTLGLGHGGALNLEYPLAGDSANMNCKQKYYSVMNYLYQLGGEGGQVKGVDYSRQTVDNVRYRAVTCNHGEYTMRSNYDVNNDWTNIQYTAGRVGQLSAAGLESGSTRDELTTEQAWEAGSRGNPGDGSIAVASPTVLFSGSPAAEQSLFFSVKNVGSTTASYQLQITLAGTVRTSDVTLASGAQADLRFRYTRAEIPPVGQYPLQASLRSSAQNAVVADYSTTVGVFAPTAAELTQARELLSTSPAGDFSPAGTEYAITALDVVANLPPAVDRVAGADRYQVAVNISKLAYPGKAPIVFVAMGGNYPDALSAGPAAAALGGPLLLTDTNTLLPAVKSELQRLAPKQIVVVGGVNSVSAAVFNQLKVIQSDTIRIGGADRYEASRNIVQFAFGASGAPTAYVATGANFPDALSAGAAASHLNGPVVLVNGSGASLDAAIRATLSGLHPSKIIIAGGPNSVSQSIQAALGSVAPVVRDGGTDRFAASANINLRAFPSATRAFLATGLKFPDALSGSAWAGALDAPLYVTNSDCVPKGTLAALSTQGVRQVTLLGGTATLTTAVESLTPCSW